MRICQVSPTETERIADPERPIHMSIFSSHPAPVVLIVLGAALPLGDARAQIAPPAPAVASDSGKTGVNDFLPEAYRADRHSSTWSRSPFSREVLPPPAGPTGPQGPTPWDGWQIAAVDKFGGEYTVGLISKKNEFHLLKVGQANDDGVKVTKVESTGVISETVVHLSDGVRTGEIAFNSKRLTSAPKGAPGPKPGGKAAVRPVARRITPQQAAAAKAAKQRAAAQLHNHLQNSVKTPQANGRPGAASTPGNPAASSSRVRRRSVVLPPSTRR
jgi:hypothetical protein